MPRSKTTEAAKRQMTAWIEPDLFDAVTKAAAARGLSRVAVMTRALALLLEELCEPVPEVTRRQIERPFTDGRAAKYRRIHTNG